MLFSSKNNNISIIVEFQAKDRFKQTARSRTLMPKKQKKKRRRRRWRWRWWRVGRAGRRRRLCLLTSHIGFDQFRHDNEWINTQWRRTSICSRGREKLKRNLQCVNVRVERKWNKWRRFTSSSSGKLSFNWNQLEQIYVEFEEKNEKNGEEKTVNLSVHVGENGEKRREGKRRENEGKANH